MARILVVDDERGILTVLERVLRKDGHEVVAVDDPTTVADLRLERIDLILLDVMMPRMDGFQLCRSLRDQVDCPILFLTAKGSEEDAVFGLGVGADDYLRKPFSVAELRAKVNAHLRRERRQRHQVLAFDRVRLNLAAKVATVDDEPVPLTPSEYDICEYLARRPGQVFSRGQILEGAFGWDAGGTDATIAVHVKNARDKFAVHGIDPFETVWGVGYKWAL